MSFSDDTAKLSKSQKRRQNKAKKAAAETAAASLPATSSDSSMTDHDRVIATLVARGFQRADVVTAIDEMWDKNLPYDNPDIVEKVLRGPTTQVGQTQHNSSRGVRNWERGVLEHTQRNTPLTIRLSLSC
jgi:hypothetical protein